MILSAALAAGGSAFAFDATKQFAPDEEPRLVLRFGYNALKNGKIDEAIGAFRFGAQRDDVAAQWKLAHMLQTGNGVAQDDAAAHALYSKIAERFAEAAPAPEQRAFVAHALVSLGHYELSGIESVAQRSNPDRAEGFFYRAAMLYHDAEAQYQLGRMYRAGTLGYAQPRQAARFLSLSARKGHVKAQTELGEMLFYGEGIRRQPVRGLVMMGKAATAIAPESMQWIRESYNDAMAKANTPQRQAAQRLVDAARAKQGATETVGSSENGLSSTE